ncbi:MAG TPA: GerMN domain-containing protein [Acidobacteriota bacterium]|nr:GerMN domain-containing protein [Acidobacteriota bacterium]
MKRVLLTLFLLIGFLVVYWFWSDRKSASLEFDQPSIQEEMQSLELYFGNSEKDPEFLHCDRVYPVIRQLAPTSTPAKTALQLLLEGPTQEEHSQGYFTSINPGVQLRSVSIEGGIARADFSRVLDEGVAGSCRVVAIRAQIDSTLRQFEAVREVQILVEGQAEAILQP